jgi:hypothetical protein
MAARRATQLMHAFRCRCRPPTPHPRARPAPPPPQVLPQNAFRVGKLKHRDLRGNYVPSQMFPDQDSEEAEEAEEEEGGEGEEGEQQGLEA